MGITGGDAAGAVDSASTDDFVNQPDPRLSAQVTKKWYPKGKKRAPPHEPDASGKPSAAQRGAMRGRFARDSPQPASFTKGDALGAVDSLSSTGAFVDQPDPRLSSQVTKRWPTQGAGGGHGSTRSGGRPPDPSLDALARQRKRAAAAGLDPDAPPGVPLGTGDHVGAVDSASSTLAFIN